MTRLCSRCATVLSAYNDDTVCGPCQVAAREADESAAPAVPLTFWFRPDVRDALGRWDWGKVLAAVGAQAQVSQTRLAAHVALSQAQVSRLMSGRSTEPGIRTVLGIVDGLNIPRLLAGLAPRGLDQLTRHGDAPPDTVEPVKRRTLGKAIIGITLAIPLPGVEPGEPVDVRRLQPNDVVADLYALDDRYGGAAIADLARRRLVRLTRQMDQAVLPASVETRVQSMIGALATCCAWLEFDRGDHRTARAFDSDALCAAHLANNRDLQVEVLASMSMQAKRNDKPAEAINLAESALAIARGSDPRVKALVSMRIALAAAKHKDSGAFRKARRTAWEQMGRARQIDRPAWFRFFDERELSALEAIGLMDLGEAREAARILAEVVGRQRTYVRNKAYYTAVRAQALVAAGGPDEAANVIRDALPVFTEVTSARISGRLEQVRHGLQPYVSDSDIAECADILAGLIS